MSRVDDERDAARAAERLAETKRTEAVVKEKKAQENKAFARLVQGQKQEAQTAAQSNVARKAISEVLKEVDVKARAEKKSSEKETQARGEQGADRARQASSHRAVEGKQAQRGEAQAANSRSETSEQGRTQLASGRKADQSGGAKVQSERHTDAKTSKERLKERQDESAEQDGKRAGLLSRGGRSEGKVEGEKGGRQQSGGGKEGQDGSPNPQFRLNPALLAPVPVAQPKAASGSERLRQIAAELAQKIVERVRLGTNAAGRVEFQIDFKSDVLSGLSVSVSAHQGKIKAIFRGHDKDVLKMIEGQQETLKSVLGARGLQLEDFKIEATR